MVVSADMNTFPLLTTIVLFPVIGALALPVYRQNARLCRMITLIITLVDLCLVTSLFFLSSVSELPAGMSANWLRVEDFSWMDSLGIRFSLALDGISLLLILLTTGLFTLAIGVSWEEIREHTVSYHFFLLIMLSGVLGVFLSTDLFLFYLFWELQTIPMLFLIGIWGHENRIYATIKFALFTISGSLFMLLAILGVHILHFRQTGETTFALPLLIHTTFSPKLGLLFFGAFALAFAIKIPLVPVHTWLPDAHTEAPTAGSVILAGLLLKTGAYGLFRFAYPLFPLSAQTFSPLLLGLGLAGMFYAGWIAFAQEDMKRLVAYSSIAHMGLVVIGLSLWNTLTLDGAFLQMINHGITTSALFIMIGMLSERLHTRKLSEMGGLWKTVPVWSSFFLFFTLASVGLPGLNNFVGEILVLIGTFRTRPWIASMGFAGLLWGVVYSLWMLQRCIWGKTGEHTDVPDLTGRELAILIPLCMGVLWIGLYPAPVLKCIETTLVAANIGSGF
jgi:NADH-quinone oxidoreductase subunit M